MKFKKQFVCVVCGNVTFKWSGYCDSCGGWNTIEENKIIESSNLNLKKGLQLNKKGELNKATTLSNVNFDEQKRFVLNELISFNKILGGGLVQGSLCLIAGSPGIGKSTLLLQVCSCLELTTKILYVSGEESKSQIKLRADRLNLKLSNLFVLSEFDIELIINEIENLNPNIVIIDSIQTISYSQISSALGSVVQVKQCTYFLQKIAKEKNITVVVVGHINKEGNIAGPKTLEHIVDVVLSFEGESKFSYRILKAIKNRFGPTNEIAVFEMKSNGLVEVDDLSKELLKERPKQVCGSCVCCFNEGNSFIFTEIQSIVTNSNFAIPRRISIGLDFNKLTILIAVLEKRVGVSFKNFDCYVNVVGGIKLDSYGGHDLALALALISSLKNIPVGDDVVAFGEIGLAGEIRSVSGFEKAVLKAEKLGFKQILLPLSCVKKLQHFNYSVKIIPVTDIKNAILKIFKK